jgi:demethylmenaquinone methyltransferase/2-methoxy-6-polyprenyl-1,4-benzoquinol methylase
MPIPYPKTISRRAALRFYNRLGIGHDRAEIYEGRARLRGLEQLDLAPGLRLLNLGVGTGKEHFHIQEALAPGGRAVGLDLSPVMLELSRVRTGAPLLRADAIRLPFAAASFDRIFSSYLLDLLPLAELPDLLRDCRRVLKPGGRIVLVSLTEGIDAPSRAVIGLWKSLFRLRPFACGGCRPLQLAGLVEQAGFQLFSREVVVQLGVPSEVVVAVGA